MVVEELFKPDKFRYRIARIGKRDAFYESRNMLIGAEGTIHRIHTIKGVWIACDFTFDDSPLPGPKRATTCFHRILLKKLEVKCTDSN